MTKKHFQLIADGFKTQVDAARRNDLGNNIAILYDAAYELSVRLQAENPRFDRSKFLKACGFNVA